jgi:PAB1-binding protein PBP1
MEKEEQKTEDWEKEWELFVGENELHGIDFSYSEDLIKSFIRSHKQKWEEEAYKNALKEVMSKMTWTI